MRCMPLLCLVLLGGCAHGLAVGPAESTAAVPTTLGTNDVFDVRVYGEDSLSGTYRVGANGCVVLPLAGKVHVVGLTPIEAAKAIGEQLGTYLRKPQVSVFVKEYNSKRIYVFGQVRTPGTFPYVPGMSLVQAITQAGGFARLANKAETLVNRHADGQEQRLTVSVTAIGEGKRADFELRPGDMVYVPESFF